MTKASWYAIQVVANGENSVANDLRGQFEKHQLAHLLEDVVVPQRTVMGMRRGVKTEIKDRLMPGYVLIRMAALPEAVHLVRRNRKVIELLGCDQRGVPVPLSESEVARLLQRTEVSEVEPVYEVVFEVGEHVKVCEGLFASMEGVVEGIDAARARLKVSVSIFGRPTVVDLEFGQVEKIS